MANPDREGKVKVDSLARLFNLSPRRVQQLAREGIVKKDTRGFYDVIPSVQGYVTYLQQQLEGKPTQDVAKQIRDEQLRRMRLENEAREFSLVPIDEVEELFLETVSIVAQMCDSLESRLPPLVVNQSDARAVKRIISAETGRIRNSAAKTLEDPRATIKRRVDSQSAAKRNTRRVG